VGIMEKGELWEMPVFPMTQISPLGCNAMTNTTSIENTGNGYLCIHISFPVMLHLGNRTLTCSDASNKFRAFVLFVMQCELANTKTSRL